MEQDKETTVVVFRVEKHGVCKGDVTAIFPYVIETSNGDCLAYAHVGQHFHAAYYDLMSGTRPATATEYTDLKRELESIGYNLEVRQRASSRKFSTALEADRKHWATLANKST